MVLKIFKIGGGVIDNPADLSSFLLEFSKIKEPKILIHGGGRIANVQLEKMGIKPHMINGRRVTDKATLEVVVECYAGLINKNIVAELQQYKVNAIGLSGADGNVIQTVKRSATPVDYGYVGDLNDKSINGFLIKQFMELSLIPVFCAITHDRNGQLLNTNADTIAANIAIEMSQYYETELHFCFEKSGVLLDINDENSYIRTINKEKFNELKTQNLIFEGMIPKLENAFNVISKGVEKVVLEHPNNINNDIKTIIL